MKAVQRLLLVLTLWAGVAAAASAHEIRPAYLQVREVEPATYDIVWKTPAQGEMRLALNVELPANCTNVSEPRGTLVQGAAIQSWRTACKGGLIGQTLAIENLTQTLTDAIVSFEPIDGPPQTLRLTPDKPSTVIPGRQHWTSVASTYFRLGVEHILGGIDHLLFVLALLILVREPKRLLGAVTAFTVAHSITLAGASLGLVHVSPPPVEATIALSIMLVAGEIVRVRNGEASLTSRLPWLASFSFGLLHGFGFAGALTSIGLPQENVPAALLFFNLGVEAGQILFIAAVLIAILLWRAVKLPQPNWAWRPPTYIIGGMAAFWFIERTAAVFSL